MDDADLKTLLEESPDSLEAVSHLRDRTAGHLGPRRAFTRRRVALVGLGSAVLIAAACWTVAALPGHDAPTRVRIGDGSAGQRQRTNPPPNARAASAIPDVTTALPAPTTRPAPPTTAHHARAAVTPSTTRVTAATSPSGPRLFFGNAPGAWREGSWTTSAAGVSNNGAMLYATVAPYQPGRPLVSTSPSAWGVAIVDPDDRTVHIAWLGGDGTVSQDGQGCGLFDRIVVQDGTQGVVLTVLEGQTWNSNDAQYVCPDVGRLKSATVILPTPLGNRPLLDGASAAG